MSKRQMIRLVGGSPWGLKLRGGAKTGRPLTVDQIQHNNKLSSQLYEGDIIDSINGRSVRGLTYDQAMKIVDTSEETLVLEIIRSDEEIKDGAIPQMNGLISPYEMTTEKSRGNGNQILHGNQTGADSGTVTYQLQEQAFNSPCSPGTEDVIQATSLSNGLILVEQNCELTSPDDHSSNHTEIIYQEVESNNVKQGDGELTSSDDHPSNHTGITYQEVESNNVKQGEGELTSSDDHPSNHTGITYQEVESNNVKQGEGELTSSDDHPSNHTGITYKEVESSNVIKKEEIGSVCDTESHETQSVQPSNGQNEDKLVLPCTSEDITRIMEYSEMPSLPPVTSVETTDTFLTLSTRFTPIKFKVTKFQKASNNGSKDYIWKPPGCDSVPRPKDVPSFSQQYLSTVLSFSSALTTTTTISTTGTTTTSQVTTTTRNESQQTIQSDLESSNKQEKIYIQVNPHAYEPAPEAEMDYFELFPRKKKMFSSSSFYEDPNAIYPTVEEQVRLCRKIAGSLSSETNKKSRGANMFFKRVKRSQKWIHEGPDAISSGTDNEEGTDKTLEISISDLLNSPYIKVSKDPPKLKLILDPRHIQDAARLRKEGQDISEHNVVSPDVCLGIVKDLYRPIGKGATLFAKRKKKSEEWIVDEEKIKSLQQHTITTPAEQRRTESPFLEMLPQPSRLQEMPKKARFKLVKSPWQAALESPCGSCEAAFLEVWPDDQLDFVAESIIRAAEAKAENFATAVVNKKNETTSVAPQPTYSRFLKTTSGSIYQPRAPKGWTGCSTPTSTLPRAQDFPLPLSLRTQVKPDSTKITFRNFNNTAKSWSLLTSQKDRSFRPVKLAVGFHI
ncbi:uncharacterized protein LOC143229532 [Tachypleus tridentatus]|uniref:uncharacterized protein LOC143229532 n=1 Tax=Tachypleus tridentatus TaxID=6853 RepID=UPI003FCFA7E8